MDWTVIHNYDISSEVLPEACNELNLSYNVQENTAANDDVAGRTDDDVAGCTDDDVARCTAVVSSCSLLVKQCS